MINNDKQGSYVETLFADKNKNRVDALFEIYKVMRPGELTPTIESADDLFRNLFFKRDRYDLSKAVGRLKINSRLKHSDNLENRVLEPNDVYIVKYLSELKDGYGEIDDIDHLGNRRVRSVGELLENQYTIGVIRMEQALKKRMSNAEIGNCVPNDLVDPKPASASVREFFGQRPTITVYG